MDKMSLGPKKLAKDPQYALKASGALAENRGSLKSFAQSPARPTPHGSPLATVKTVAFYHQSLAAFSAEGETQPEAEVCRGKPTGGDNSHSSSLAVETVEPARNLTREGGVKRPGLVVFLYPGFRGRHRQRKTMITMSG